MLTNTEAWTVKKGDLVVKQLKVAKVLVYWTDSRNQRVSLTLEDGQVLDLRAGMSDLRCRVKEKLALEAKGIFRTAVVTASREKLKRKRTEGIEVAVTRRQARLLRFIWMRDLKYGDRFSLNWAEFGGLLARGWVEFNEDGVIVLTDLGRTVLGA